MMSDDSDKTMVRTRRMPFRAGAQESAEHGVNVLPVGTHLGEFEILDLIGEGGFGIVYLAYDHSLERHVALKEYMPAGLASRTTKMAVTVRSEHNAATFTAGLRSFINEAKMLAQFDSPALVKVHRFWEGNGTAYMVMPYYEGVTLKQALKEHRVTPTESWIRLLLADLFDAIETIHNSQCLHRDIAPDNILLLKDGRPVLLDFGAARRVIGDLTQCLTVILKPGFAPIEQYADIAGLRQGTWTDIYALAAVTYYVITGKAPPPAVARMVHDEMVPAREAGKGRYSSSLLGVLDKALAVKPEQRYRSIAELRKALDIMGTVPRTLPRSSTRWTGNELPTTRVAEPKPVPRQEPRLDAPRPGMTIPQTPAAQHDPLPQRGQQRPDDMTMFQTRRPEAPVSMAFGGDHMPPNAGPIHAHQDRSRAKTWGLLSLLLAAGLGAGVYLGTQVPWKDRGNAGGGNDSMSGSSGSGSSAAQESGVPSMPKQAGSSAAGGPDDEHPQSASIKPDQARATPPNPPSADAAARSLRSLPSSVPGTPSASTPTARRSPDEESWQNAIALDTPAAYENYLKRFPKGLYALAARQRLEARQAKAVKEQEPPKALANREKDKQDRQEKQEKQDRQSASARKEAAATPSPEEDAWNLANNLQQAPAYEAYLSRYPKGRYAALARDKLTLFKQPPVHSPSRAAADEATRTPSAAAPSPTNGPLASAGSSGTPAASSKSVSSGTSGTSGASPSSGGTSGTSSASAASGTAAPPASAAQHTVTASAAASSQAPAAHTAPQGHAPRKAVEEPLPKAADSLAGRKPIFIEDQILTGDFSVDQKTGIVSGTGRIVWSNGNQFDGTLVRGMKEGRGNFRWASGQRYVGEWSHDLPNGRGTLFFANGNRYDGEVRDGVPDGRGTAKFKNGDAYAGAWARGKSNGFGRYTWADGSFWEGEFRDDKRTENGKMVFADKEKKAEATADAGNALPQEKTISDAASGR
ncbi:serine/threonine-protein kinase [Noviherbaspirillum galbum]|uniref:Protein kinase n=1 Tax=Noviherbaspirillum galbum TaxID=2709383 RepID=A0A6B3SPF8_9BURK|nr:serine/threonine-protein kinase [Noviherbaspirillum galbum]NEX62780.1 protein kinase [Noviherbaspirillum galbum]